MRMLSDGEGSTHKLPLQLLLQDEKDAGFKKNR